MLHSYRSSQGASVAIIISISININFAGITDISIKGIISITSIISINIVSMGILIKIGEGGRG